MYKYYTSGNMQTAWRLVAFSALSSSLCKVFRNAKASWREAQVVGASLAALSL